MTENADDMAEHVFNLKARLSEAQRRMNVMILARDPDKMDEAALASAQHIEDLFARGYGSTAERRRMIQSAIRSVIENVISGGKPEFV